MSYFYVFQQTLGYGLGGLGLWVMGRRRTTIRCRGRRPGARGHGAHVNRAPWPVWPRNDVGGRIEAAASGLACRGPRSQLLRQVAIFVILIN